eukprot:NODE_4411_length_1067_cov_145.096398_g4211_i0.p1 GENE.NODE_4411_length_1067_cov_145.096398_g4211_i0~~NODE_4411_length_1067_cov_145.096398_g4211_i0.p1  ORF type:complete len:265 (+),score=29.86 NODE_4411_length_1067_cov_145.096398_g4211_i0:91-885(+)
MRRTHKGGQEKHFVVPAADSRHCNTLAAQRCPSPARSRLRHHSPAPTASPSPSVAGSTLSTRRSGAGSSSTTKQARRMPKNVSSRLYDSQFATDSAQPATPFTPQNDFFALNARTKAEHLQSPGTHFWSNPGIHQQQQWKEGSGTLSPKANKQYAQSSRAVSPCSSRVIQRLNTRVLSGLNWSLAPGVQASTEDPVAQMRELEEWCPRVSFVQTHHVGRNPSCKMAAHTTSALTSWDYVPEKVVVATEDSSDEEEDEWPSFGSF